MGVSWYPCGCSGCIIGTDKFGRATIGSTWSQESGSWSISSNELTTADSDAYIKFLTVHPDSLASHVVDVEITFDTDGDKAGVVLSEDLLCVVEYDTGGDNKLHIYESGTLVATSHVFDNSGSATFSVRAGYQKADSVVWIQCADECLSWVTDTPTSFYVGLGTETITGDPTWDNFAFQRAYTASWTACPDHCLECYSCDDVPPNTITITPDNFADGDCACASEINGISFVLDAEADDTNPNHCRWYGSWTFNCTSGSAGTLEIEAWVEPNVGGSSTFMEVLITITVGSDVMWVRLSKFFLGSVNIDCEATYTGLASVYNWGYSGNGDALCSYPPSGATADWN